MQLINEFAEPIICALCGAVMFALGASFLAGASIGIAGFATLCKITEAHNDG